MVTRIRFDVALYVHCPLAVLNSNHMVLKVNYPENHRTKIKPVSFCRRLFETYSTLASAKLMLEMRGETHAIFPKTFNIPSLARQRCLPSWGPRRTPCIFFFVISQLFDAVDYSNYVFWVSETIIQ